MNGIKWLFFDLDGTLTDSAPGLAESFTHVIQKHGIDIGDTDLRYFMGPPITQSLAPYFNTEEALAEAIKDFRAHYSERMLSGNSVYTGIAEMLEGLTAKRYRLAVVTGKPQDSAEKVIEHFKLSKYFEAIYGAKRLNTNKIETLREALDIHNCQPEQAVMVGDRKFDLGAAQLGKTGGIGVLWGYGNRDELEKYNHLLLANTPSEITKYFGA